MSAKSSNGHTTVAVKNSHLGTIALIVGAVIIMGGLGSMGQMALTGAGKAADSLTPTLSPPGNANRMNEQARRAQTTPPTTRGLSDDEMAKREAAKELGDKLGPIAPPVEPGPGVPTLENPGGGGGGILGELPVIGGSIEAGVKALGPGLKALNP